MNEVSRNGVKKKKGKNMIVCRVSHSVVPHCLGLHALWPTRLLCPWNFPGKNTGVGCHFLHLLHCRWILYCLSHWGNPQEIILSMPCYCVHLLQLCPTLYGPIDCSPPGSSVHGIFQAKILDWVTTSSSKRSS